MERIDFIIDAMRNIELTMEEIQKEIDSLSELCNTSTPDQKHIADLAICEKYLEDMKKDKMELIDQYNQEIKLVVLH